MYRQWWLKLATLALLVLCFCSAEVGEAFAEPTVEVLPAPEVEPKGLSTHGDGSITVNNNCSGSEEENAAVTISPSGSVLSEIPRVDNAWNTGACNGAMVSGYDNTVYVAQALSQFSRRIVAIRNGTKLWTTSFKHPSGYKEDAVVESMVLGRDGNLYAYIYWNYERESDPQIEALASIDSSTGAVRFIESLPNHSSSHWGSEFHHVMPYEKGVAVLNVNEVFFFNYQGEEESSKAFLAAPSGTQIPEINIVPNTGRIYWVAQDYNAETLKWEVNFYYRDLEGSTQEIELPEGKHFASMKTTPFNGVVVMWSEASGAAGFSYINEEGVEVYQETLSSNSTYSLSRSNYVVDDLGNVIVRRKVEQTDGSKTDRNVVIDLFSSSGVKTQLFSSSSLGTEGVLDSFISSTRLEESVSKRHVYITLCHAEGKLIEECNLTNNPIVVSVSDSSIGNYDYPRSAIFSAGAEQSSYVALGDSYSSGEGVPSFIPPSSEDGCHRSYGAYPAVLANEVAGLRLDAFVACSGATTTDVEEGMKEEPSQLYALDSSTNLVTITIGGNDVGFGTFAEECVIFTCDSSSPAYEYSMEQILSYLPAKLESLYEVIHSYAENAEVYVVGYPQVAPEPGVSCAFLTNSEKEASREVVSYLDKAIKEAVEAAGGSFHYVDPNSSTSPFAGHELCTAESYFNGVEISNKEYSFHPNAPGQEAYAALVAESL